MNTLKLSSIWFQKKYHWTNEITKSKVLAFSPKVWKHVSVTIEISRRTLSLFLSVIKGLPVALCNTKFCTFVASLTLSPQWQQGCGMITGRIFPWIPFSKQFSGCPEPRRIRMPVASSHPYRNRSQMIRLVNHNNSCYRQKTERETER